VRCKHKTRNLRAKPNVSPPGALSPIGEIRRAGQNFPSTIVTWPKLKCIGIRRTRIVDLGLVNMSAYNYVRSGPNFTKFFFFNAQKIILVNAVYILLLSSSVPEIFALKLESCHKSHRFLHVFCPPKFQGGGAPKSCTCVNTPT